MVSSVLVASVDVEGLILGAGGVAVGDGGWAEAAVVLASLMSGLQVQSVEARRCCRVRFKSSSKAPSLLDFEVLT